MTGKTASYWVCVVVAVTTWVKILEPTYCDAADPTFDVGKGKATNESYSKLLNDVRDIVKDPTLNYGFQNDLPVVAAPTNPANYFYIDIVAEKGTITAAFSKNDVYFLGYAHTVNGNKQARLLKDAPNDKNLFKDITADANRLKLSITGSYIDLERYAGNRGNVGLGPLPLNNLINNIYKNKKFDIKFDATLSLVVIQTLAEATRFKYIQDNIIRKIDYNDGYKPEIKDKDIGEKLGDHF